MNHHINIIFKKEFKSYFRSKLGYFILSVYLVLSMSLTFFGGNYFQIQNTGLFSFFYQQPEIFVLLIPALTMKIWADERRSGTMELLLTQPVSYYDIVIGKFLAAWLFCLLMLVATFPLWITTAFLINVDNLNISFNYLGCFLTAGALCAVSCLVSSFNSNPVSAYLFSIFVCALLKISNFDDIIGLVNLPNELMIRVSQSLNFDFQYQHIILGQISWNSLVYFGGIIVFSLWLNVAAVEYKKG